MKLLLSLLTAATAAQLPRFTTEVPAFPEAVRLSRPLVGVPERLDADGDGLEDRAEAELAEGFKPFLVFDSAERDTRAGEPVTLYQVRPAGCAGLRRDCPAGPLRLSITYLNLWARDGGYGPDSWCGFPHNGDNQTVRLRLESRDGVVFRIVRVENAVFAWPDHSGAAEFVDGTHVKIYFSAGKHHQFFDTRLDAKDSPHSSWGCNDSVDGRGAAFLSELSANVGEPERQLAGDLAEFGYPGEHAFDKKRFCGGLGCDHDGRTGKNWEKWSHEAFQVPSKP